MTDKPEKPAPGDPNSKPKNPRGFGGVVLILALLLALFVVVSTSGMEGNDSEDAFYSRLFRGQVTSYDVSQGVITAEYEDPAAGDKKKQSGRMEAVLTDALASEFAMIRRIVGHKPAPEYSGGNGLAQFYRDMQTGKVSVKEAFLISELPGRKKGTANPKDEGGQFMSALVQIGDSEKYLLMAPPERDEDRVVSLPGGEGAGGAETETTVAVDFQKVRDALQANGVPVIDRTLSTSPDTYQVTQPNTALQFIMVSIVPWLLILLIVWFFILRQMRSPGGGGGVLSFGRSRAALYTKENRTNITFDDVAGMTEAKAEVKEIIEFLKNPGKFAKLGGSIPRGVLLVGSPGTGKTLLAKAIAGEAEVPFFSISGSDFVEMFVGVGASRVRDLFQAGPRGQPLHHIPRRDRRGGSKARHRDGRRPRRTRADPERDPRRDGRLRLGQGHHPGRRDQPTGRARPRSAAAGPLRSASRHRHARREGTRGDPQGPRPQGEARRAHRPRGRGSRHRRILRGRTRGGHQRGGDPRGNEEQGRGRNGRPRRGARPRALGSREAFARDRGRGQEGHRLPRGRPHARVGQARGPGSDPQGDDRVPRTLVGRDDVAAREGRLQTTGARSCWAVSRSASAAALPKTWSPATSRPAHRTTSSRPPTWPGSWSASSA